MLPQRRTGRALTACLRLHPGDDGAQGIEHPRRVDGRDVASPSSPSSRTRPRSWRSRPPIAPPPPPVSIGYIDAAAVTLVAALVSSVVGRSQCRMPRTP